MGQPLDGIRVVDLTHYLSGPFCTKLLADHGADVIKVERPGLGDGARRMAPFSGDRPDPENSGLFQYLNTSKRGITLNLKSAGGRRILQDLLSTAQVLVESYSPRVMPGLGLAFDTIHQLYPALVMTSISSFGQTGPYRDFRATELMEYAMGGPMYVTGDASREPVKIGDGVVQFQAGAAAALATMISLYGAELTGTGEHIDISIMETQAGNIDRRSLTLLSYQYTGDVSRRLPAGLRMAAGAFPTRDGYVELDATTPIAIANIPEIIERPELARDPRFADYEARARPENTEAINAYILQWLEGQAKQDVWQKAQGGRVMAGPINTSEDLLKDPHFHQRGFWTYIERQAACGLVHPGTPISMSESPGMVSRAAPALGQHNREILSGYLGYSRSDLAKLRETGVI
ncbi:MAG: CoA transferase [Dehalococcoidia bacterium]